MQIMGVSGLSPTSVGLFCDRFCSDNFYEPWEGEVVKVGLPLANLISFCCGN